MFHEYREQIVTLKQQNGHFGKIFDKHNDIDEKITEVDKGRSHMDQFELESLKKEKLKLKDEIHSIILKFIENK